MFGKAEDRILLARASYKRYFNKNLRVTKRFDTGGMSFLGQPKHEPKTAEERDEQIAKSKLLPKSTGHFYVISAYLNVVVIYQAGSKLPVSVDPCSKAPVEY